MKFSCSRQELVEVLSNVSRAAAVKSTLKVIEGVLFKVGRTSLYVCCYNLELGIAKTMDCTTEEPGDVVMPIKLCDYVRKMSGDVITIECNEKYAVQIASDDTEFSIIGMPALDFPELPTFDVEHTIKIPENRLRTMFNQTVHAISTRQDMPVQYSGGLFEVEKDNICLVTLDGYRVAVRNEPIVSPEEYSFIVPGKTMQEVSKLLDDSDEDAELEIAKHNIMFFINGYCIISRLMAGSFMNYRSAIESPRAYTIEVNTSSFLASLDRINLVISEADKSPVRCRFGSDYIRMLCETQLARVDDRLGCKSTCTDFVEVGLNNRYMFDAFKAVDSDVTLIKITDGKTPILIVPPEGNSYCFLLMPVLLKEMKEPEKAASRSTSFKYDSPADDSEEEEPDFGSYDED